MRAAIVVVAGLGAAAGPARAGYDVEWRDGCPPGNIQVAADADYSAPGEVPAYAGTDPRQTGAAPQLDSALVPSRLLISPSYTHFANTDPRAAALLPDAAQRVRLVGAVVQAHGNVALGRTASLGVTGLWSYQTILPGDAPADRGAPGQAGNLVIAPALRFHWLTSGTVHEDRDDSAPEPGDAWGNAPGLRHGIAFRLLFATRPWGSDARDATTLVQRTAFDSYLAAPHWAAGGAFETRSEGIGCYAPFVHLRLSAVLQRDDADQRFMWMLPQTLAVGFSASTHLSLAFQYGLLLTAGSATRALLGPDAIHRFRFGTELTYAGASVGAHLDLFRGSALYDGIVLGVYVSTNFPGGESL